MVRSFVVSDAEHGKRADVFVSEKYPKFTRASLVRLFEKQSVRINGGLAKPGVKLKVGDKVGIDDTLLRVKIGDIDLPIIYEDKDVLVIDKPGGVLTHSKGAINDEPTVASFIRSKLTDKKMSGNRAGIVHRLDRGTSGVIITAKNEVAQKYLQVQFSSRKVRKTYLAIVEGVPEYKEALIDVPIERNPKAPQTFIARAGGKVAKTYYKCLKSFENGSKTYSLLELTPETGRTHQLRVHLKHIGHPIAGDYAYGSGGEYLYLHAQKLQLTLPSGEDRTFEADIPEEFSRFMKND